MTADLLSRPAGGLVDRMGVGMHSRAQRRRRTAAAAADRRDREEDPIRNQGPI
jgi:hypothetical protein